MNEIMETNHAKLYEALALTLLMVVAMGLGYGLPWDESAASGSLMARTPTIITERESTPVLFPSAGITLTVLADGTGDYTSLASALEAAPAGATLRLGPGVYQLDAAWALEQPLRLIGAGITQTEMIGTGEGHVLRADGAFAAEDVSFRYAGEHPGDVVIVTAGPVQIARCSFSGAVFAEDDPQTGVGLRLQGETTGTIIDSRFVDNGAIGLGIENDAHPMVIANESRDNTLAGMALMGHAGGTLRENVCTANFIGIYLNDEAQPTLEENVCTGNEKSGLAYMGDSGGVARGNRCSENGREGIYVGEQARPTLAENHCAQNEAAGIDYFDNAGGWARGNICTGNARGIYITEHALPTLEENECTDNENSGLTYAGQAGGVARGNLCSRNGLAGIYVGEQASPTLEENHCAANGKVGIAYFESAGGVARGNTCEDNPAGVHIAPGAAPFWEENACE